MSAISQRSFAQAFQDARGVFLNDPPAGTYTNTRLLPIGAYVHAEIQDEFSKRGIPILETVSSALTYTAGDESIPIPGGISDTFQAPLELWEQDTADSSPWIPMVRVPQIPPPYPSNLSFLGIWEWRNGTIITLPCSMDRNVWCRYRVQGAYPTKPDTDLMGSEGFYWALVAGVAYYAAGETEPVRPAVRDQANAAYRKRTMDALQIASRDRQSLSFRQQSPNPKRWYGAWGPFQ